MEHLHEVRGRLDVALDLIRRAADGLADAPFDRSALDELEQAMKALAAATAAIDETLGTRRLGPAA